MKTIRKLLLAALTISSLAGVLECASDNPNGAIVTDSLQLRTGAHMPVVGLGTWQVIKEQELKNALDVAREAGYRHIDTATIYMNEHIIGSVLKNWTDSGKLKREDIFITTKIPFNDMSPQTVPKYLDQSLNQLQTPYVDMYLIHAPAKTDAENVAVWKVMEAEVDKGRVKAIGLSNFDQKQIENIIKNARIMPANLQNEIHLFLQQPTLNDFCKRNNITVTAYSPLGSPGSKWLRPPNLLGHPEVKSIATRHGRSPAQVLLRHLVQKGLIVIPKSTNPKHIKDNIQLSGFNLDDTEMAQLNALDKGENSRILG